MKTATTRSSRANGAGGPARLAGLTEVPAIVLEADDRTVMELALIENLQRSDLNPIEEALGYRALMEEYGLTQEQTAEQVGKSRPAVANALAAAGAAGRHFGDGGERKAHRGQARRF